MRKEFEKERKKEVEYFLKKMETVEKVEERIRKKLKGNGKKVKAERKV